MFTSRLHIVDVPPNLWRLEEPLIWDDRSTTDHGEGYGLVEFPVGMFTDLGSTPQRLRRFKAFDPTRVGRRPAVGHDYLYAHGKWPNGQPVTREEADRFLHVALLSEGVSKFVAWLWWKGVRIGGRWPWNEYRAADDPASPH